MKEATPEQIELFRHRLKIITIVRTCQSLIWIVGCSLFAIYSPLFGKYGVQVCVGSFIAYFVIDLAFWVIYFRCPACGQPFLYLFIPNKPRSWAPPCCENCQTNYTAAEDDSA